MSMRTTAQLAAGVTAALAAAPSHALELDYYTYNAFEETVAGFQRLALTMNDGDFGLLLTVLILGGVLAGALVTAFRAHTQGNVNPLAFAIPVAVGLAVFKGLVLPTGSLHVYDPVRNAYQEVEDVPDLVVLLAGGLSKVEQLMVRIVDSASAHPYAETAGGIDYSLLLNATSADVTQKNLALSLGRYYEDCGTFAISTNLHGVSRQELYRGSTDLFDTFAKFVHPALFTVYYAPDDDNGVALSCTDAWLVLAPQLEASTGFDSMRASICNRAGFNWAEANQQARCDAELTRAAELYGITAATSVPLLRSMLLANAMSLAMNSDDWSLAQRRTVDRQLMAEGFGAAEAMNQWVPKLRGYMLATVLAVFPLTALFIATPLLGRALTLIGGLFLWLTLWGITDAVSVQMAQDAARDAFEQLRQYGLGYEALMNTPEAAVQALGVFGKARTMGLMLATALSAALFKFGGYAFTQLATNWQNDLNQAGEAAGQRTMLPEQAAAYQAQLTAVAQGMAPTAQVGFATAGFASASGSVQTAAQAQAYVDPRLSGMPPSAVVATSGRITAAEQVGELRGVREVADARGTDEFGVVATSGAFGTAQRRSGTLAERETTMHAGIDAVGAGGIEGTRRGGGTVATGSALDGMRGSDRASQGIALGRQESASLLGQIRAADGDAETVIDRYATESTRGIAHAQAIERTSDAALIGRSDAVRDDVAARGTLQVERQLGRDAMVAGSALQGGRAAGAGRAASRDPGGAVRVGAEQGRVQFAREIAANETTKRIADFLGLDATRFGDLVDAEQTRNSGHLSLALTPDNLDTVLPALQARGLIDEEAAEYVRLRGGGQLTLAMDPETGNALEATVTAGNRAFLSDKLSIDSGREERQTDTETVSIGPSYQGAVAIVENRRALAERIEEVYEGGEANEARFAALAGVIGESMRARGISISAENAEAFSRRWEAGARGSVGIGASDRIASGGVFATGSIAGNANEGTTTRADGNYVLAEQIVRDARLRAEAAIQSTSPEVELNSDDAQARVASRQARLIQSEIESVYAAARSATTDSLDENDVQEALTERDETRPSARVTPGQPPRR